MRDKIFQGGRLNLAAEPEILHHFERLIFTATKIRLMVNPLGDDHQKLIEAIDSLLLRFRTATEDLQGEAQTRAMEIIAMSLRIIRNEWLGVQRGD